MTLTTNLFFLRHMLAETHFYYMIQTPYKQGYEYSVLHWSQKCIRNKKNHLSSKRQKRGNQTWKEMWLYCLPLPWSKTTSQAKSEHSWLMVLCMHPSKKKDLLVYFRADINCQYHIKKNITKQIKMLMPFAKTAYLSDKKESCTYCLHFCLYYCLIQNHNIAAQ